MMWGNEFFVAPPPSEVSDGGMKIKVYRFVNGDTLSVDNIMNSYYFAHNNKRGALCQKGEERIIYPTLLTNVSYDY
ncbi:hypothetical protein [Sodalis praecaptivus]|uniref:hypothetical protein n=1 Tax=Sodalis praecaptivus TaxID=1239307 RepID=UPI0031F91BB9